MVYTGYLQRRLTSSAALPPEAPFGGKPYILVTAGGGGDGSAVFDWVLRAYEKDPSLPVPAFFVLGPFLDADQQASFNARIERLDNVASIVFDTHPEALIPTALSISTTLSGSSQWADTTRSAKYSPSTNAR